MVSKSTKDKLIGDKIKQILKEGVRKNTRRPLSASNKRGQVSKERAATIAESMFRRGKLTKRSR